MKVFVLGGSILQPELNAWVSNGGHEVSIVTPVAMPENSMVLADPDMVRWVNQLAERNEQLRLLLRKDPLVMLRPDGLLSVVTVPSGVASIVSYSEMGLLEEALCPRQLDPVLAKLVSDCGVFERVHKEYLEVVSIDHLTPYVAEDRLESIISCRACEARVQVQLDALNSILRNDPNITLSIRLHKAFGDKLEDQELQKVINYAYQLVSVPNGMTTESVKTVLRRWHRHEANCTQGHRRFSGIINQIFLVLEEEASHRSGGSPVLDAHSVQNALLDFLGILRSPDFETFFTLIHEMERRGRFTPLSQA